MRIPLITDQWSFIEFYLFHFQLEYEMPLLAPVKDKRVLNVHQVSRHLGDANHGSKDFVHMFLTNRYVQ